MTFEMAVTEWSYFLQMLRSLIKPKIGFPVSLDHDVDLPNLGIASDNSNGKLELNFDNSSFRVETYWTFFRFMGLYQRLARPLLEDLSG